MKKLYYALIIFGALDILLWLITGLESGWVDFIFGSNAFSQHAWWIMIGLGIYFLNKEKAKEKSEIEDVQDLEAGENVVFKNVGQSTIVTITTKKIIFRAFDIEDRTIKDYSNVISDEKRIFNYTEIASVKPIKYKDISKNKIGKLIGTEFGISLEMKDGVIANLMTSKNDVISAHINKYLNP
jgi:uncharacterized membrane protein YuzA (DUF378 family)